MTFYGRVKLISNKVHNPVSFFFFLFLIIHKQQRTEICASTGIEDMEKALEVLTKPSANFENEEKLYSCLSPSSPTMMRNDHLHEALIDVPVENSTIAATL